MKEKNESDTLANPITSLEKHNKKSNINQMLAKKQLNDAKEILQKRGRKNLISLMLVLLAVH